ncbi:glycoside hydrolase family 95 protein [Asticcacaulis excentricus]|uniref:Alpha-L-fucosidase n=1 Tax=Asticcacaulis excentricus (strain ATCC 15261 / DSM 4724 / KCTC 12464 / NCIMB 9791 / VKM B-1370 / CB 48) TaxID=573065 RepID=E8RUW3_ASTEC|nr:glycoside hydrolase family 95 protein [Asticcacaulis excentricus]ADU14163.1 Alpha-L-fucosidase [Asticcacaulis excentricus CB 48]
MPHLNRRLLMSATAGLGLALSHKVKAQSAPPEQPSPDLSLWYERPADEWVKALPVGNGRLGGMVFGGVAFERIQLNEDTFFAGSPYTPTNPRSRDGLPQVQSLIFEGKYAEAERLANETLISQPAKQMAYQPVGDLILLFPGLDNTSKYVRRLDLSEGVAVTEFNAGSNRHRREVFVSAVDQVMVVRLSSEKGKAITVDLSLSTPQKAEIDTIDGDTLIIKGVSPTQQGIEGKLPFELRAKVIAPTGTLTSREGGVYISGAQDAVVLISAATGYVRYDDISGDPSVLNAGRIAIAAAKGYAALKADHLKDYKALFDRVSLSLGEGPNARLPTDQRIARYGEGKDPGLAALYLQYGRYLLVSSSRGSRQPANLQGIWNDKLNPSWQSKWTLNINTQMNYWPAEMCNLTETIDPLVCLVEDLAETGAKLAKDMYGAPGWVAFNNTDVWRVASPPDGAVWALWPMGGAWLLQNLWEPWLYNGDEAYLRRIYPLMKGASEFYQATLLKDPRSDYMVTNPSNSPENRHPFGSSVCAGPAMDNQLLRDLFAHTAEAAKVLKTDAAFARACLAMRSKLPPEKIGKAGQLQEWQEDWDMQAPDIHHRHVSHLYALHPSDQITVEDTPELAQAARKSLEIRGDDATGWGIGWRINLWARLKDGDHAHDVIKLLLHPRRSYPNLFDAHPPFQIDGNFGGAAGIAEMLIQSHRGRIELLPALPSVWPTGAFKGLKARGGFELDIEWQDRRLTQVVVRSARGGKTQLRWGDRLLPVTVKSGQSVILQADPVKGGGLFGPRT